MFCKYKDIFGKVNEGVHKHRIMDIAIVDVVATIILAFLIHYKFKQYNFIVILAGLFVLGVFSHRLFCVRTTIDKLIFK